jgi:hypothetical protein
MKRSIEPSRISETLTHGTTSVPAEQFGRLDCLLHFQAKTNNIIRTQLADLGAYPCARHILNPDRQNRAYEIARKRIYERDGISGWKVFP